MKLVSLICTQCAAQLPPQKESGTYTCSYCGAQFAAPFEPPPSPPNPIKEPSPKVNPPSKFAAKKGSRVSQIFLGFLFVFMGLMAVRSLYPVMPMVVVGTKFVATEMLRPIATSRSLWDSVGGPPVPVQIGGHDAVLGRLRLSDDQLFIVATDSTNGRRLWSVGPLGTYGEAYRHVYFAATAQHLLASDGRGNLHIAELASGKEVKQIPLRDRATNLCAVSPHSVAVAVLDRHHVMLDTDTMTLTEHDLPAGCGSQRRSVLEPTPSRVKRPSLHGFDVQNARVEGELAVAAAVKSPGTPIPYAIGFTPGGEVHWQTLLPTVDPLSVSATDYNALAGGRYLAIYGVGSDNWHLTALEAEKGARLWDVALRPLFAVDRIASLLATPQFVYVTRTSSLEIFDAATGKLIGTVGSDTYR